jgi:hypothetical protein
MPGWPVRKLRLPRRRRPVAPRPHRAQKRMAILDGEVPAAAGVGNDWAEVGKRPRGKRRRLHFLFLLSYLPPNPVSCLGRIFCRSVWALGCKAARRTGPVPPVPELGRLITTAVGPVRGHPCRRPRFPPALPLQSTNVRSQRRPLGALHFNKINNFRNNDKKNTNPQPTKQEHSAAVLRTPRPPWRSRRDVEPRSGTMSRECLTPKMRSRSNPSGVQGR